MSLSYHIPFRKLLRSLLIKAQCGRGIPQAYADSNIAVHNDNYANVCTETYVARALESGKVVELKRDSNKYS